MRRSVLIFFALLSLAAAFSENSRNLQDTSGFTYGSRGSDWTGTCSSGLAQSPINLGANTGSCDSAMALDLTFFAPTAITLDNTGQVLFGTFKISQLFATDINGVLLGYEAEKFMFHAPAEHQIEGTTYALELQIVHTISSMFATKTPTPKGTAIVSILFEVDDTAGDNAFITSLAVATAGTAPIATIDIDPLVTYTGSSPYFLYEGSFTTPSCTEDVNWYVFETPLKITSTQLADFTALYSGNAAFASGNGNNRAIQELNDRTVKKSGMECEEQFVYFFSFLILYIFINYFIFKLL